MIDRDDGPQVAVLIVNFNSGGDLVVCLQALARQTRRPCQVLIVDNASTDGSCDAALAHYPDVTVVRLTRNIGFAAANNLAAALAADCQWLALLNPDAFPEPTWLAELTRAALLHPECAAFGSRLLLASNPDRLDGTGDVYHVSGMAWRRDEGRQSSVAESASREIFSPCAAAALYQREAFIEVGGFDPTYFCYHEDVDLGFRLRLAGHQARYVPAAVCRHGSSATSGRRSDFSAYHGHRNLVWTYCKNMPASLALWHLPQALLMHLAAWLRYLPRGQGGVVARAKLDALVRLPAVLRKRRAIQRRRRIATGSLARAMRHDWLAPYTRR